MKSYKVQALKWHPDKNQDEDTTERFQQIQEAYQVLSNPDDRAWYDSHRDQILSGKSTEETKEADMNYMTKKDIKKYMHKDSFKSFDIEKENNFYKVYRELFSQLDHEEELEEQVGKTHKAPPGFGDNLSTAEEVFAFYSWWAGFATMKQFTYADTWDARGAPNRRIKRIIETENQKERNREKREFNQVI